VRAKTVLRLRVLVVRCCLITSGTICDSLAKFWARKWWRGQPVTNSAAGGLRCMVASSSHAVPAAATAAAAPRKCYARRLLAYRRWRHCAGSQRRDLDLCAAASSAAVAIRQRQQSMKINRRWTTDYRAMTRISDIVVK